MWWEVLCCSLLVRREQAVISCLSPAAVPAGLCTENRVCALALTQGKGLMASAGLKSLFQTTLSSDFRSVIR